ncbi:MAG: hypothetical protein R2939_14950 [Kofleriaceae bacterium]
MTGPARIVAGALVAIAVRTGPAAAELGGAVMAHYEGSYVQTGVLDDDDDAAPRGLGLARLRLRGVGPWRRGPTLGFELGVGSTRPGGFAYEAALYPLGLGAQLGEAGSVGVVVGIGASGAVGTVDDAALVPVSWWIELPLGRRLRVLGHGRLAWVLSSDARDGGSPTVGAVDELEAMVALRVGRTYQDSRARSGNGWFVGGAYREAEGHRFVGAVLGYSIDLAMARH